MAREQGTEKRFWATLLFVTYFGFFPFTYLWFLENNSKLSIYHKDPFDRMLIAQALVERLTIITVDEKFKLYNVPLLIIES